jgi:diguanylate cyclase
MNSLKRMRMELFALKRNIEDALYALDPLTGISGRIGLLSKLREQQALVKRGVRSCCVALMDLDNFKSVNDVYGHAAGDKVLAAFARHITQSLRPYDKVFRYGGEEFLIVLPETSLEKGANIIERLRQELARLPLDIDSGVPLRVIASFGIVQLDHGIPVEEAVARTDRALYQAKATGRDRSLVWDSSMTPDGAVLPRDSAT